MIDNLMEVYFFIVFISVILLLVIINYVDMQTVRWIKKEMAVYDAYVLYHKKITEKFFELIEKTKKGPPNAKLYKKLEKDISKTIVLFYKLPENIKDILPTYELHFLLEYKKRIEGLLTPPL